MAVRFSADGQDYTRALALGSQSAYTVCCWAKLSVDRNTWSTLWSLDNGTGDVDVVQTDSDGTTLELFSDGNNPQFVAMTVGTWYFVGVSRSGTGGTAYYRAASTGTLSTVDLAGSSSTTNMATLRIGESPFGTEWLNGCIAAFKFWTAALTADEIAREAMQYAPARVSNQVSLHPFVKAETTDYSGNGRTLSGGSGTATEDGPPIPWQVSRTRLILPAGAGSSSLALPVSSETDAAQPLGRAKVRALGVASETDAAQALARGKARALGTAAESETAQPLGRHKVRALGTAVETDAGQALGRAKVRVLAAAAEVDAAQSLGRAKTRALTNAGETDAAQVLGRAKARTLGVASELDTAATIVLGGVLPMATAGEVETAQSLGRHKRLTLNVALETDTALQLPRGVARALAPAAEADTARALGTSKVAALATAAELDIAVVFPYVPLLPPLEGNGLKVDEITATMESFVRQLAVVESVNGGDLRHMVGPGLHAGIWFVRMTPIGAASGLGSVSVRLEYNTRLYGKTESEPSDFLDPEMTKAVDAICNAFAGQFTLDGLVRNVDIFGAHGQPMLSQSGYLPVQEGMCRIVDISVPLVCNDVWILEG